MRVFDGDQHVGYGAMARELSTEQIEQQLSRYQTIRGPTDVYAKRD